MGKSASKQFANEAPSRHNEDRRRHQAPPLKQDSRLNGEATSYAQSLASTRILKHSEQSSRGSCGENLARASCDQSASEQFVNEALSCHNEHRRRHQAPPLKLNSRLNREATSYAQSLASMRVMKHSEQSSRGGCGENLAWATYDQSGKNVSDRWYDEVKLYNFNRPGFSSGTGHFTAIVWKSTEEMGIGKATASDGSTYVVARYSPAGNITNQGYFESNVLPAK